jgi:NhaA family Na+:H+ antiporter
MVRAHIYSWIPYAAVGLLIWIAAYQSGVHATIAGVAMGLLMPVFAKRGPGAAGEEASRIAGAIRQSSGRHGVDIARWNRLRTLGNESVPMLERFEHALHPWSSFVILPIFALSSAGIVIRADTLSAAANSTVSIGVVVGLIGGNIIGIPVGAVIATRLGLARLPDQVTWPHVVGAAAFAGIGFTVSIFVATLAFDDQELVDQAKLGILVASIGAGIIGALILRLVGRGHGASTTDPVSGA